MRSLIIDLRMINYSGIGTYLKNLVPFFKDSIFSLKVLGNVREVKNFLKDDTEIIPFGAPIYSISEQLSYPLIIPRCDVFWSPHFNAPILPIKAKKRIVTIHDVYHLAFYESFNSLQKVYIKLVINSAVNLSDKIITVSNFSKSEIIKYTKVNPEKIEVIYNGVDNNRFKILDRKVLEPFRSKYPENFILYVGNVKPHKNLKNLLKAFSIIQKKNYKDYYLVIVGKKEGFITGDKEIFQILEDSYELRTKVIFTGYIEDDELPVLYNLARLFVFPSLYEGFGLPPLEAMACGCPTVVSNLSAIPEVCGDASFYVNPLEPEEIALGILKVLNSDDLRKNLIEKGLERVKSFNWEKSAKKHRETILTLLDRG